MPLARPRPSRRPAAVAPLACVLAVFLLGMVAFAVDLSWIVLARAELQNAADAAALAGAHELMDAYVQYHLPQQSQSRKDAILAAARAAARERAKAYAKHNQAGGQNALALLDADIEFGFLDTTKTYTAWPGSGGFPNTVKATVRRDAKANTPLKLFFAPAIGTKAIDLTATAAATIYGGTINSFRSDGKTTLGLLPVTYDVHAWDEFLKTGKNSDGGTATDKAGDPQLQVYPNVKHKGNFGELAVDDEHAGSSEIRDWIQNGATPAIARTLTERKLLPLASHDPTQWDWLGNPGFRSSTVSTMNAQVGRTYVLPLFQPVKTSPANQYQAGVGGGSDYNYNIVRLVGVRIVAPADANREVVVQPAAVIEPEAAFLPGSVVPAGSTSQLITTFTTPKLSG